MATTHKHHSSPYGKPDENTSAMFLFTFLAVLVAVALFAFILVQVFGNQTISADMANAPNPYTAPTAGGNAATLPSTQNGNNVSAATTDNSTGMNNTQ